MSSLRDGLERFQAPLYVLSVVAGALWGWSQGTAPGLQMAIQPALALMLYVTFLQVPVAALRAALGQRRFAGALLTTNFVAIPLLVGALSWALPSDDLIRFAALLVLLAPCVDYVVTFAQMGQADARLLLAATPVLLLVQMLLLPVYLHVFLGAEAAAQVHAGPFVQAFVELIVLPLLLAWGTQWWAARSARGARVVAALGILPVLATAVVLAVVVAAVVPYVDQARAAAWGVLPVYLAFAVLAPVVAWGVAKAWRLPAGAARAVAFSGSTRNALVVLPLVFAVPGAMPVLPAVIVTQTLVELLSELVYVRIIARWR